MSFGDTRGQLTLPVAGRMIKSFGSADAYGGQEKGLSLETPPGALVTAPSDGWISFAGPYRSYGQLLIVNAGEGYYLILAGMARADVVPGQFVLAGEPLGAMGDGSAKTASAIALGAAQPVLYVEFRKDGTAIDPSPWWAKVELEKVRG
jgi:septal ring factor EnvC (AmiA/AmiB activator)